MGLIWRCNSDIQEWGDNEIERCVQKLVIGIFLRKMMYVCMSMYVYVCLCMSMYVYVCLCMSMYVYVCLCMSMYVYVCLCM